MAEQWIKVGNGKHTLAQPVKGGPWGCTACHKSWQSKPRQDKTLGTALSVCPGVPVYEWGKAPPHLKRPKELKAAGLVEVGDPKGCIVTQSNLYYLWDETEAQPIAPKIKK